MEINNKNLTICLVLAIILTPLLSSSQRCNASDKKALLQIKKAFKNPKDLLSWDPQTDCCSGGWSHIECNVSNGRIDNLFFHEGSCNTLVGPIPEEIGDLSAIRFISFSNCLNIVGQIPRSITKLPRLRQIIVNHCKLSGPVPEFLAEMKTLELISLSSNRFTGPIPRIFGTLRNLSGLMLGGNQLTGTIPENFGRFWEGEFFFLFLDHNRLTGPIPASLGTKKDFVLIDLSGNNLVGHAEFLFGADKMNLSHVDLSGNSLSFDFSAVKFPETLNYLDISSNKIFGTLPAGLTKLSLKNFNVSQNQLCGKIPVGGDLQKFGAAAYSGNRCLCGNPLPKCQ